MEKEKSGTIDKNMETRKKSVGRVGEVWWMRYDNTNDSSTEMTVEHTEDCAQQGAEGVHLNLQHRVVELGMDADDTHI